MAIANNENAVIEGNATLSIKDAALIQLELTLICLDGDAHRLTGHSLRPWCVLEVSSSHLTSHLA